MFLKNDWKILTIINHSLLRAKSEIEQFDLSNLT